MSVLNFLLLVFLTVSCVTDNNRNEDPTPEQKAIFQRLHGECMKENNMNSCIELGQFLENDKMLSHAHRFYSIACANGNQTGCALKEDVAMRVDRRERDMVRRNEADRQFTNTLMDSAAKAGTITPVPFAQPPAQQRCRTQYNPAFRQYDTICD